MMYALGLGLGVVGAVWYLAVARWRAMMVEEGHPARARMAVPVGAVGPLVAFFLALALVGEPAGWAYLAGALLTGAVVHLLARQEEH